MKFEIKHRWSGAVLFSVETDTFRLAVEAAIKSGANLSKANLSEADLSWANLRIIKHDIWGVLLHARAEVPALRQAIVDGRINGSVYSGECACLCGTIANARGCNVDDLNGFVDSSSPAERFFLALQKGDTPEKSPVAKIVLEWVDEFIELTK